MAWFIEKTMRFWFKFSDFDLYINILTILKFQNGRLSFTMTQATLPGLLVIYHTVAFVQESSARLSILKQPFGMTSIFVFTSALK